jgi:hypothetical protein
MLCFHDPTALSKQVEDGMFFNLLPSFLLLPFTRAKDDDFPRNSHENLPSAPF